MINILAEAGILPIEYGAGSALSCLVSKVLIGMYITGVVFCKFPWGKGLRCFCWGIVFVGLGGVNLLGPEKDCGNFGKYKNT